MNDGGISTREISATFGKIASAVSAAGSAQGDATAIDADLNLITTASAGQGVILPTFAEGDLIIANGTSVDVLVYPPSGGKINNGSANAAITLYAGTGAEFTAIASTQTIAVFVFLPSGSITTAKLADGAVTTAKIGNDQVTYAKIQNISATQRVLGRNTAGSGDTEEVTITQFLDWLSGTARGDIIRREASAWNNLAIGTSGQLLKSDGTDPAWATVSSNVLIASGAISSAASVDIAVDGQTWDEVEIHLLNLVPATDNVQLYARFSQASAFLSGASDYQWAEIRAGSLQSDAADSEIQIGDGLGTNTNERFTATLKLFRPTASSFTKTLIWHGGYRAQSAAPLDNKGWGELILNTDAIEDVQFLMSSDNIASGYYYAIGKKFSA